MRRRVAFSVCLIALAFFPMAALARGPQGGSIAPVITFAVDESRLVTLLGARPPVAPDSRYDLGRVDDALQLDNLLLALKRSPENEARLERLIDAMHDAKVAAIPSLADGASIG
jgi:hypothetical protein